MSGTRVSLSFVVNVFVALSLLAVPIISHSGSLVPPGTPAPTMLTLSEIGTKVDGVSGEVAAVRTSMAQNTIPATKVEAIAVMGDVGGGDNVSTGANSIPSLGFSIPDLGDGFLVLNFENEIGTVLVGLPPGHVAEPQLSKLLKYVDASSPKLLSSMKLQLARDLTIKLYRRDPMNNPIHYYSFTYENVKLRSLRQVGPNLEELEFSYTRMVATHHVVALVEDIEDFNP